MGSQGHVILSALRGKLAAALHVEAKAELGNFAWLESLQQSAKGGRLARRKRRGLAQCGANVRKRIGMLQLLPGTFIAIVLIGLSVLWTIHAPDRPARCPAAAGNALPSPRYSSPASPGLDRHPPGPKAVLKIPHVSHRFRLYQAAIFPASCRGCHRVSSISTTSPATSSAAGLLCPSSSSADVLTFKKLPKTPHPPVDDFRTDRATGMTVLPALKSMLAETGNSCAPTISNSARSIATQRAISRGSISDLFSHGDSSGSSGTTPSAAPDQAPGPLPRFIRRSSHRQPRRRTKWSRRR